LIKGHIVGLHPTIVQLTPAACLVFLFGLALGLDQPKGKSKVKHQTGNSCTMLI